MASRVAARHPDRGSGGGRPDLPVAVARSGVQHTWDSYPGALDDLVRAPDWEAALHRLSVSGVPITLAEGHRDPTPVPGRAAAMAADAPTVQHLVHPDAAHLTPLAEAGWCVNLIAGHLAALPLRVGRVDR